MQRHLVSKRLVLATLAATLTFAAGCDDVTAPTGPIEGTFTVNAVSGWSYVNLSDSAIVTPTPSASASPAWDMAFFSTNVSLNGGQAGPGGVSGYCVCQNASATGTEVLAMTATSEKADFEAVTAVPTNATFTSDVLTPAVKDWFTATGAAATAAPSKTFLVRLADSLSYAKVRVTNIAGATATTPGQVTIEYAVQPSATAALGATKTLVVDVATGAKSVDLNTGTITTGADWDLRFEAFAIRVNSGISGPGKAAAAVTSTDFAATTTAKTADQAYQIDRFAGVFAANPYYRYNIAGDNRISPTFDVYLIKRGTSVYKVQILNYYNETGSPRYITFRYKRIAE